jgi:hypothetical protein
MIESLSIVIPDGSRSEPIRDPSPPAPQTNRKTGSLGSRLSRFAALGRDDNRELARWGRAHG